MKSVSVTFIAILSVLPVFPVAAEAAGSVDGVADDAVVVVPALLAILVAIITRHVIPALFLGIWAGAWIFDGMELNATAPFDGLLRVIDTYLPRALVPEDGSIDRISIVIFTLLTGGMIGIIARNGGMQGIVAMIAKIADTPKKGQFAAAITGMAVFFDDYANTLIVGNTMRPLIDKLRISRAKLAYLVDSTAAPIATIALMTTWIGFQVSLVKEQLATIPQIEQSAYEVMIASIPYNFYPILCIIFLFMVVLSGRDFGPMLAAEKKSRARAEKDGDAASAMEETPAQDHKAVNALLPIAALIFTVIAGIIVTGNAAIVEETGNSGESLRDIFGHADPYKAMLWASMLSLITAIIISAVNSPLRFGEIMTAMEKGFHPMLMAVTILALAWGISQVNDDLGTADYLVSLLGDGMSANWIPAVVFVLAAAVAFATGTSWGTMGIMMPLVVPLTWSAMSTQGVAGAEHMGIFYAAVSGVLAGAVWGDHCSPISDTTILSSIASGCDHIEHVRTQMPYALVVGMVALFVGIIPAGYGVPWWIGILSGAALLFLLLKLIGRKSEPQEAKTAQTDVTIS